MEVILEEYENFNLLLGLNLDQIEIRKDEILEDEWHFYFGALIFEISFFRHTIDNPFFIQIYCALLEAHKIRTAEKRTDLSGIHVRRE